MKAFLKNISLNLKNYSLTLDKTSILINQPWAMIDEEFEMQKLIFKKNGELILSKNGKVSNGRWEYFAAARSLLIDRGTDKILCKEQFIDSAVMILKLDGTDDQLFAMANENILPSLDIKGYLISMFNEKNNIITYKLKDGNEIGISTQWKSFLSFYLINHHAYLLDTPAKDGRYFIKDEDYNPILSIKDGVIQDVFYLCRVVNRTNEVLYILTRNMEGIFFNKGDKVFTDDQQMHKARDGQYRLGIFYKITVRNGVIV